jgi:glycosyltransferase involved in cell wall biosynthesis
MPKVSVIIPTYNRSEIIAGTIRSVLEQTVRDIEVIVVDDGSPDNTPQVVQAIVDSRVRYFRKDNGGPADARNFGLEKTNGEFTAFLDHDDYWPTTFLEVMTRKLYENPGYGLVYCPITEVYPDGRQKKSYGAKECKSGWITVDLFKRGVVWTSASVMRRDVLAGFGYDKTLNRSYEDGDFFLRLSVRCPFLFTTETNAFKRIDEQNFSTIVGIEPTRILILRRFLDQLGGDKIVPKRIANKKLSLACRKVAKANRQQKYRKAALYLYQQAMVYNPCDVRLYGGWLRAYLMNPQKDKNPRWQMPLPLPEI